MSENTFLRPLTAFDPKKNLLVDESFKLTGGGQLDSDPLADLEVAAKEEVQNPDLGKELFRLRMPAGVVAGLLPLGEKDGAPVFFAVHRNAGAVAFTIQDNKPSVLWSKDFAGSVIRTPASSDHLIHILTREGMLIGLRTDKFAETSSLEVAWQKKLGKGSLSEICVSGNTLIAANLAGLTAFDVYFDAANAGSAGRQVWFEDLSGIASSPIIEGGNIYLGTEDKTFYAFEHSGHAAAVRWKFSANEAIRMKAGISLRYNYVLFGAMDGSFYCLDRYEGTQRWYLFLNAPVYGSVANWEKDNAEYFYFGADNGYFYCLDTFGRKVWTYRTGGKIRSEPVVHEGVVYFGSGDNYLYGLDCMTGRLIFRTGADGDIIGKPVIYKNMILFGSADNFIHGVRI
ncbi:MAG: PQQ-like beta-propeller repeat protein [Leptospiraceae bacterium]|nr:PQQ-like beta-propeller repeat protein [Leptospiraceae bacterium]